ncbi:MAG TPA: ribonuclease III domain-containing protein [Acholeplasma sp.]|nr:ribonuclease III domain-containing protein [Acholeplasma sp.]
MQARLLNGVALAYIGDAYFELSVRQYLLSLGFTKVNELHKKAIKYTSGQSQSDVINQLIACEYLSETEVGYFKKGRNASGPGRKNIDMQTYHNSTGFEAVVGFLYLEDVKRADEFITKVIEVVNSKG